MSSPVKPPKPKLPESQRPTGESFLEEALEGLDALEGSGETEEQPNVTNIVSLADMQGAPSKDDLAKARKVGVSIASTLIEPLPEDLNATLDFGSAAPPMRIAQSVTVIGRAEGVADVILPNDGVLSRQHAALIYARGDFYLEDLRSSNGTFVNDQRISCLRLQPGDKIRMGTYSVELTVKR